jgi:hypothetical protein
MGRNLQIVISPELEAKIEKARGSVPRSVWARDILERWLAANTRYSVPPQPVPPVREHSWEDLPGYPRDPVDGPW